MNKVSNNVSPPPPKKLNRQESRFCYSCEENCIEQCEVFRSAFPHKSYRTVYGSVGTSPHIPTALAAGSGQLHVTASLLLGTDPVVARKDGWMNITVGLEAVDDMKT
jgi:hypothetical protein